MKHKTKGKDVLSVVIAAILAVVLIASLIVATIGVGYVVGMFIAILPYVSDWITTGLPIDKSQIPTITAWFALAGLWLGGSAKAGNRRKDG